MSSTNIKADRSRIRSAALKVIRIIKRSRNPANRDTRKDWLAPPPLSAFRRLEPIGFGLNDETGGLRPDDCTPDLVWPLDVGVVVEKPVRRGTAVQSHPHRDHEGSARLCQPVQPVHGAH